VTGSNGPTVTAEQVRGRGLRVLGGRTRSSNGAMVQAALARAVSAREIPATTPSVSLRVREMLRPNEHEMPLASACASAKSEVENSSLPGPATRTGQRRNSTTLPHRRQNRPPTRTQLFARSLAIGRQSAHPSKELVDFQRRHWTIPTV